MVEGLRERRGFDSYTVQQLSFFFLRYVAPFHVLGHDNGVIRTIAQLVGSFHPTLTNVHDRAPFAIETL